MVAHRAKSRFADRVAGWFGFERRQPNRAIGAFQQGYAAAQNNRLMGDFMPGGLTADVLHMMDAKLIRERARNLVENNPMAKAAVKAYVANVIRCGIEPKPSPSVVEGEDRKDWIKCWEQWTMRDADVTRAQHFNELQKLFLEEVIVAGGCLVRFVYLDSTRMKRRKFELPFTVELIPEERFAEEGEIAGYGMNGRLPNGNLFARGVEIDPVTGEHVAYWLKRTIPNDLNDTQQRAERIPAEQCIYAFNRTRIGQHRGFSFLSAVIVWLWKLGYYTDNELMASAIKSCFSVLIKTSGGNDYGGIQDGCGTVTDQHGNLLEKLEPGIIGRLNHGDDVVGVGPNTPPGDAQAWMKFIQRSIAVGMDLSYFGMMRDTADSNFAGFRAGLNEDRSRYEMLQDFTTFKLIQPTYERWVKAISSKGLAPFPLPREYAADPDFYNAAIYQAPGWVSVAPLDDAKADEINVKIGTDSRTRIVGRRGEERSEIFEELKQENDQAEELELTIASEPPAAEKISSEDRP